MKGDRKNSIMMCAMENCSIVHKFESKDAKSNEANPNSREDTCRTTSKGTDEEMIGKLKLPSKRN